MYIYIYILANFSPRLLVLDPVKGRAFTCSEKNKEKRRSKARNGKLCQGIS